MNPRRPAPDLPDRSYGRARSAATFVRAVCAVAMSAANGAEFPHEIVRRAWPNDRDLDLLVRTATSPATTTTSTWAGTFAATALADFIVAMGPASAGAALLARGLQLQFDGSGALLVPGLLAASGNATFVGEAAPIPVRQFSIDSGPTLAPRKFATITPFTREIFQHSIPNIERLVGSVLAESIGLALDGALLDANAADATRPAGLRNGISAVGSASTATSPLEAMAEDISTLAGAVAAIAGNAPIIFVAATKQATAMRLWARNDFAYPIFATGGLAAGTVVAVASNSLVSALDPAPRLDISTEALLHMDTSPAAIGTVGTPNVVAAPVRSLYQTDSIALRLRMEVSWGLRNSGGLAWLQSVNW